MNENPEPPASSEPPIDALIEQLGSFLALNPKVEAVRTGDKVEIRRPWDDPSVMFSIEDGQQEPVDALNSVYLPPPYSAIWHDDSKDLEFIYTSLPKDDAVIGRSFQFLYLGREIVCEYAQASERLLMLSSISKFTQTETASAYRNLHLFQAFMKYRTAAGSNLPTNLPPPTSFWVRNIDWDDEYVSDLCKHINFYMHYFDRQTPHIVILQNMPDVYDTPCRLIHGAFPLTVNANRLNPDLLDLLAICQDTNDPIRQIMHSYQILEYVAHYHTKGEVFREIRRLLLAPDAVDRIERVLESSIDAMAKWVRDDDARMKAVIKEHIDPRELWPVIEHYKNIFSQDITFDGGHRQELLIKSGTDVEGFVEDNWPDNFFRKWKGLRNVVVHARQPRLNQRISPTVANIERLHPWALLSMAAAEQLVIYSEN